MARYIRVFTELQIVTHKHAIHMMLLLILTGLPFVNLQLFGWIPTLLGAPYALAVAGSPFGELALTVGLEICRIIHRVAAIVLLIWAVVYFVKELRNVHKWQIVPKGSLTDAIRSLIDYYIHGKEPRFGKYNAGQKAYTWGVFLVGVLMYVTGFIMWFRNVFSPEIVSVAHLLHAVFFVLICIALVIHVYLAVVPQHRPMLHAMFRTGYVHEEFVKKHMPLWYEELKRRGEI